MFDKRGAAATRWLFSLCVNKESTRSVNSVTCRRHFSHHSTLGRACQPRQPLLHERCLLQYFNHLNSSRHWRHVLGIHHQVTSLHNAQVLHACGDVLAAPIRCSPTTIKCLICRSTAMPGLLCLHGMPKKHCHLANQQAGLQAGLQLLLCTLSRNGPPAAVTCILLSACRASCS